MVDYSSYPGYLVARYGLAADAYNLTTIAELGFDVDTNTGRYGDGTTTPPRVLTDKSTGQFDYSKTVGRITLPGGLFFDSSVPGAVSGVVLAGLVAKSGLLINRGTSGFSAGTLGSSDTTLTITNGSGQADAIDIRLNPNSDILKGVVQALVNAAFQALVASAFYEGRTAPTNPTLGQRWYDTDENVLYTYVSDGTTAVWLETAS